MWMRVSELGLGSFDTDSIAFMHNIAHCYAHTQRHTLAKEKSCITLVQAITRAENTSPSLTDLPAPKPVNP